MGVTRENAQEGLIRFPNRSHLLYPARRGLLARERVACFYGLVEELLIEQGGQGLWPPALVRQQVALAVHGAFQACELVGMWCVKLSCIVACGSHLLQTSVVADPSGTLL